MRKILMFQCCTRKKSKSTMLKMWWFLNMQIAKNRKLKLECYNWKIFYCKMHRWEKIVWCFNVVTERKGKVEC